MTKDIYINITQHEKRVAVLVNKRIEEFYTERPDYVNLVGNIYKGKVESVLPGMGAAFVNIGLEKNGFLYVTDVVTGISSYEKLFGEGPAEEEMRETQGHKRLPPINELLKKGDDVLVQIVKEPIGTKGARLTTHISIPGRFLVMMPFDNHVGISKRIESREERDRIRKILQELKLSKDIGFTPPLLKAGREQDREGAGFIVRTAAQGTNQKDFFRESRYLLNLWNHIRAKAKRARPPLLIHQEYDIVLRVARDIFTNDAVKLEIDSRGDYKRISRFLRILAPHLRPKLKFYCDRAPLFEKYEIEKQIEKIYERIVHLRSGGSLIFDETESLVAIDVNSGKFVGKKNLEDTAFKTNLEAAEEIPRQLKLRDIGGIIIIDFIDMEAHEHRRCVFKTLEAHLEKDKAKTNILNISSIGLVEMTRQRIRKSMESKMYQKCPYCSGRGIVKNVSTVAIELMRKLEQALQQSRQREVFVSLNPEVAYYCSGPERNMVKPLERKFRKPVRIIEDPTLRIEEIKIEDPTSRQQSDRNGAS